MGIFNDITKRHTDLEWFYLAIIDMMDERFDIVMGCKPIEIIVNDRLIGSVDRIGAIITLVYSIKDSSESILIVWLVNDHRHIGEFVWWIRTNTFLNNSLGFLVEVHRFE